MIVVVGCVQMGVCTHTCIHAHIHAHIHACIHACAHTCIHAGAVPFLPGLHGLRAGIPCRTHVVELHEGIVCDARLRTVLLDGIRYRLFSSTRCG
jgi:hypothetical protein